MTLRPEGSTTFGVRARRRSGKDQEPGMHGEPGGLGAMYRPTGVWLVSSGACAVGIAVVLPTLLGGWAPLEHWSCADVQLVDHAVDVLVPGVLVNSPYLGYASGTVFASWTDPGFWTGPPPSPGQSLGFSSTLRNVTNGSVGGLFYAVNVSVYHTVTVLVLGPGPTDRCLSPLRAEIQQPSHPGFVAVTLPTLANQSDAFEPTTLTPSASGVRFASPAAYFHNGFGKASQNLDTCSGIGIGASVISNHETVLFNATWDGQSVLVPYTFHLTQQFIYHFPAGGIWAVDNLSAPGGPGGGWAFSYSACP